MAYHKGYIIVCQTQPGGRSNVIAKLINSIHTLTARLIEHPPIDETAKQTEKNLGTMSGGSTAGDWENRVTGSGTAIFYVSQWGTVGRTSGIRARLGRCLPVRGGQLSHSLRTITRW